MAKTKKTHAPLILGAVAFVLGLALLGAAIGIGVLPLELEIEGVQTGLLSGLKHFIACFVFDAGTTGTGETWWAASTSLGGSLAAIATITEVVLLLITIIALVKKKEKGTIGSALLLFLDLVAFNIIASIVVNGYVSETLYRSLSFWYSVSLVLFGLGAVALGYDVLRALLKEPEVEEEVLEVKPAFDEEACRQIVREQIAKIRDEAPAVVTKEKAVEIAERVLEGHIEKFHKEKQPVIEEKPAEAAEEPKEEKAASPFEGFGAIKRASFAEKLEEADEEIKGKYQELHDYVASYGIKSRVSIPGDTFAAHRERYVFLTLAGKHIKAYFALDPKDYAESKIPVEAVTSKKFEDLPCCIKIRSDLSLRRAMKLVDDVMAAKGVTK